MEDTWLHVKCSPTWPSTTSSSSLEPAAVAPPSQVSAAGLMNQVDMNSRQFLLSFIPQGTTFEKLFAIQEPILPHALNIDFAKSGNADPGNSFLSPVSTSPHHLHSELSQLAKLRTHSNVISSSTPRVQCRSIPSSSQSAYGKNGSMWMTKIPSFDESRSSLMSDGPIATEVHSTLQMLTCKEVPSAFEDAIVGKASMCYSWPANAIPGNSGKHLPLNAKTNRTTQRMPTEADSAVPRDSARSRGLPRVICMKTVGELFLSELGLLGVVCFCHNVRMSLAKFCEHSGSSANPNDVVHLENGMTIAQWRKLCFGNNAPDDDKGWDWSDGPLTKDSFIMSWDSSYPTLPQNPKSADSIQAVVGFDKSGEPRNKSSYAMPHCMGVQQAPIKYPINKVAGNVHPNYRLERGGFISPTKGHVPVLSKSFTVHAVKENPNCLNSVALRSILNMEEQNVCSRFVANSEHCKGKSGTPSLCDPHMDAKSLTHESNSSKNSFATAALMVDRDGHSSNIDLHLGQPSQVHNSLSCLSTAVNSVEFGAVCNPQKSQDTFPLTEHTDQYRKTKKLKTAPWCPSSKLSITHRGPSQHAVESSSTFSHSEPKELAGNATKSSLISLFLSHLGNEGSNALQSTTTVNNSELRKLDSTSTKCIRSEHISGINGGNKRINLLDGSELSNNLDKGKRPIFLEKIFHDPVKPNFMAHSKKTTDIKVPEQATGGQCLHSNSSMDNKRFSLHFSEPTFNLQSRPVSVNSNQCGKVPFGMMGHYNRATNSSMNPVLSSASRPCPLYFGTPMNPASSNSLFNSETASMHSRSIGQHLTDDTMQILLLRHMVEPSKREQSSATLERDPRNQRSCCHSSAELQRNLHEGSSATEDLRREAFCDAQQTAYEYPARSLWSSTNCFSGIGSERFANKNDTIGTIGRNEFCNNTILTQRDSQCSKEPNISTCHVYCANEHPCLRLGRMPNRSFSSAKQIFDQTDHTTPFFGKCCCSMLAKHLTCCCTPGDLCLADSKECVCGKPGIKHITQASGDVHICHDMKSSDLCECTKKHFGMKKDGQTGFWRDVPAKKLGHSDAISTDRPSHVLKSSRGTGVQLQGTASKGSEGTQREVDSMNEQQMSNVCCGSSAPAATEISVEVNKVNNRATSFEDNKNAYDFVADEGSRVEKCGSSDGAICIGKPGETPAVNDRVRSDESGYVLPDHSSGDIIGKARPQTSYNKNKAINHMHIQCADQENFRKRKAWKEEKRRVQLKMKKLDVLFPESGSSLINLESSHCASHLKRELSSPADNKSPSEPENMMGRSSVKRKHTLLLTSEPLSVNANSRHNILKSDKIQSVNDDLSPRTVAAQSEKEELTVCGEKQFSKQEGNHFDSGKPPKYMSLNCIVKYNNCETDNMDKKVRPVVCGKSGIISNGSPRGPKKPVKIVSLSLILKRSKRCDQNEYGAKSKKPRNSKAREVLNESNGNCNGLTSWKVHCKNEDSAKNRIGPRAICMSCTNKRSFKKSNEYIDGFSVIDNEADDESKGEEDTALHGCKISQITPRYKEVHKSSFSKLLGDDEHSANLSCAPNSGTSCTLTMSGTGEQQKASSSTALGDSLVGFRSGERSLNNENHDGELSQLNTGRYAKIQKRQASLLSSDVSCCVCGSSNKEDINCLLECNRCLIRVHQACYGVSKVPRGHWFCRPCKTNTQNTVCVLCGYDGGAMTRAIKSRGIVKSLLKAWNFGTLVKPISSSKKVEAVELYFAGEASKCDNSGSITSMRLSGSEFAEASVDLNSQNRTGEWFLKGLQMVNSITAGVLDPSVTQWVHMVCGLWTPGTRCPNVDTMSAFDVSGASAARKSTVCSMCNRSGGCCIKCRVLECPDHFHPWCAHQKGLLQSEFEGEDNERVGFYGRCVFHASQDGIPVDNHPLDTELECSKVDWSCARTEGFEGWKRGEGFKSKLLKPPYNGNRGCIVSPEQRNAWIHINGQNSFKRAFVKQSCSDLEYDFQESSGNPRYWKKLDRACTLLKQVQKEYFHYKQSKAWKHLVVYKSGIHALGLYTSQFITRGAMVVEYVGEIVGQRVADKRETEYQSGRKLQYKSACYFFRIDKEHIIDATRKGGIARFVNHSCQPNCVAKIISLRNEKKVVFFAERDIYPGEEITYDYHFNSEEDGEKIPCFCNSKNCRRYLN